MLSNFVRSRQAVLPLFCHDGSGCPARLEGFPEGELPLAVCYFMQNDSGRATLYSVLLCPRRFSWRLQTDKQYCYNRLTMTKYITSTPGIIAGTRIPVSRIVYLLSQGYTIEAIHEEYSWVSKKVLKGVIDEIVQLVNTSPDVTKVSQVQTAS
jgi:uncharacterized protein (DUF433 family)